MKNRDLVSSLIWMALGGLFVIGALREGLIRKGVPGPGFFPFLAGVALVLVSLFVLIPALRSRQGGQASAIFPDRRSLVTVLLALVALLAYGVALEYLGYLLTTFLFMLSVSRLIEPRGWLTTIGVAALTAAGSYLLFIVLLEVQLPQGPFGF